MDRITVLVTLRFITYCEHISCAFPNDAYTKMILNKQNTFLIYDFHIQLLNALKVIPYAGNSCHILDSRVKAHSLTKEEMNNSAGADNLLMYFCLCQQKLCFQQYSHAFEMDPSASLLPYHTKQKFPHHLQQIVRKELEKELKTKPRYQLQRIEIFNMLIRLLGTNDPTYHCKQIHFKGQNVYKLQKYKLTMTSIDRPDN